MKTNCFDRCTAEALGQIEYQAQPGGARSCNGDSVVINKIEQSIAYMLQHLDRPLQVSTLAAQANVSTSHFFALFKRRTGSPPIDFFIRLRMERARELLEASSLHVKEVAAVLGYDDPFYFSRVFKSVNQMSPSDYRATRRERSEQNGARHELPGLSQTPQTVKHIQFA